MAGEEGRRGGVEGWWACGSVSVPRERVLSCRAMSGVLQEHARQQLRKPT